MQQLVEDIKEHQSRVVEAESFQEYLQNVNEKSLPKNYAIQHKYVDFKQQSVTFHFEFRLNGQWTKLVHFAKVIEQ